MTERLRDLLSREASDISIPASPADRVVQHGRRLRRRRRLVEGVAVLATIAVVGGGAAALVDFRASGSSEPQLAMAPDTALDHWAVASGSTVYLANGRTVDVEGKVKSVYYTSAGVLVRRGPTASTDSPHSYFSLVTEDGSVTDFPLDLGDRVPDTDIAQPYVAYAEATGDPQRWRVVLRDVRSGEVAHRVPIAGKMTWGGWVAPPVALSGDHVYVAMDDATLDVNWRTGEVSRSEVLHASYFPDVNGGRVLDDRAAPYTIRDAQSGELLLEPEPKNHGGKDWRNSFISLAPDGRHALVRSLAMCFDETGECSLDESRVTLHDVDSRQRIVLDAGDADALGWTPDGWLVRVDDDSVDVCDPDEGTCFATPIRVTGPDETIRVGGSLYES